MKPLGSRRAPTTADLVALTYELLDAHRDTSVLARRTSGAAPSNESWSPYALLWAAHLDYLQALQRVGREILARVPSEAGRG